MSITITVDKDHPIFLVPFQEGKMSEAKAELKKAYPEIHDENIEICPEFHIFIVRLRHGITLDNFIEGLLLSEYIDINRIS